MNTHKQAHPSALHFLFSSLLMFAVWLAAIAWLFSNVTPTSAVTPSADIEITISASPEPVNTIQKLFHTIIVRNNGPDDASNVAVKDFVPFPYVKVSSCYTTNGATCSQVPNQSSVVFTTIAANTTVTFTVETLVAALILNGTSVSSIAEAYSDTPDPNMLNNSATVSTTFLRTYDAELSLNRSPEPVSAGQEIVYTLTIQNLSSNPIHRTAVVTNSNQQPISVPSPVTSTVAIAQPFPSEITVNTGGRQILKTSVQLHNISHPWPEDLDILLVGPSGKYVTLMSDAGGTYSLDKITLTFDDSAPQLPSVDQIVTGVYRPINYTTPGQSASDLYPSPGPGTINDAAPYLGQFNGLTATGTWKLYVVDDSTNHDGLILEGWSLILTMENQVVQMYVAAALPTGASHTSSTYSGWGRYFYDNVVGFTRQTMSANYSSTIVFTARAPFEPVNGVTSIELNVPGDSNLANNSLVVPTTILPSHDLAIGGSVAPAIAVSHEPLTYTVIITNSGPSTLQNGNVSVTLPTEVTISSIMQSQGSCSVNGNVVICDPTILSSQPLNSVATVQIVALAPADLELLESSLEVTTAHDPDISNNSASLSSAVVTPTPTFTSTETATATATPKLTSTESPTGSATPTFTATPIEHTPTETLLPSPSFTSTPAVTKTQEPSPNDTPSPGFTREAIYLPLVSR